MAEPVLLYDVSDSGVATLLLNRPDKRNALNGELVEALEAALARAADDRAVAVVCIRGAGKDFCSGADLAELEALADLGAEESLDDARRMGRLFVTMRRLEKPVVAVVHGRALAGGCGLATACDIVLARDGAELGYPEVHLGFVPAMVMSVLRRKVGEGQAFELVSRGHRVSAREAASMGLVTRVLPADGFDEAVTSYLEDLASRPALALALTKRLLYGLDGVPFEDGVARGAEVNVLARLTDACREGVRRFLSRTRS